MNIPPPGVEMSQLEKKLGVIKRNGWIATLLPKQNLLKKSK